MEYVTSNRVCNDKIATAFMKDKGFLKKIAKQNHEHEQLQLN